MTTRRRLLQLAGLGVAAGGLGASGCGSSDGESSGGGKIRFTWWGNNVRHDITQQAIDLFQQQNSGIQVGVEPAAWTGYWDKLATTVASGDAPDAMQQVDPYVIEYAQRGALADLKQFSGVLDLSPYDEAVLSASTIDGKVYGAPGGLTAPSFWVNPQVLAQVGEKLPDDSTWSWEEYAVLCERIAKKSNGAVRGSNQLALDEQTFGVFVRQKGVRNYDGKKVALPKDVVVEWWEYCLRLQDSGAAIGVQQAVENQGKSIEESALVTGKVAFALGWATQVSQAQEAGKVSLQLAQIPGEAAATARGAFVKPSLHFSISARSKHGEASARLIDFLINSVDAGKILRTDRGVPANAEVLEAIRSDFSDGDKKAAEYVKRLGAQELTPLEVFPAGSSEAGPMMTRYTQAVLFKKQSPADAAEQFLSELQAAIQ